MQKIRFYLISLLVLFLLSLVALVYVFGVFSPDQTNIIVLVYVLAAVATFSATTLIGFYLRRLFGQREFLGNYASSASRQGFWLAIILVVSLLLSHNNLFTWTNAGLLVFAFIFFESYLLTKDKTNNQI